MAKICGSVGSVVPIYILLTTQLLNPFLCWEDSPYTNLGARQSTSPTEGVAANARNSLFWSPRLQRYTHVTNQILIGQHSQHPTNGGNKRILAQGGVMSTMQGATGNGVLMDQFMILAMHLAVQLSSGVCQSSGKSKYYTVSQSNTLFLLLKEPEIVSFPWN